MSKALSVRQPWAHLLVTGQKPVENRSWKTSYRGRLYIHAAIAPDANALKYVREQFGITIQPGSLVYGSLIGYADLVDVTTHSDSPWFFGRYGLVFASPTPIEPIPLRGQLGIFELPLGIVDL